MKVKLLEDELQDIIRLLSNLNKKSYFNKALGINNDKVEREIAKYNKIKDDLNRKLNKANNKKWLNNNPWAKHGIFDKGDFNDEM